MKFTKSNLSTIKFIFLILILFVTIIFSGPTGEPEQQAEFKGTEDGRKYKVVKVVDGDTIKIEFEGKEETVRLIGIDAPESVHPSEPVECFGIEASEKLKSLLEGAEVKIEFDSTQGEQDRYGRLLLYVWKDEQFINELMILDGYAHEYTYKVPYKYQEKFQEAEVFAERKSLGLWGDLCDTWGSAD